MRSHSQLRPLSTNRVHQHCDSAMHRATNQCWVIANDTSLPCQAAALQGGFPSLPSIRAAVLAVFGAVCTALRFPNTLQTMCAYVPSARFSLC